MSAFLVSANTAIFRPAGQRRTLTAPEAPRATAECRSSPLLPAQAVLSTSRRDLLSTVVLYGTICSGPLRPCAAAETALPPAAPVTQQDQPSDTEPEIFETSDFYLRIPRQFQPVADDPKPIQRLGRGQAPPQTPLKARFLSATSGAQVTVVAREAFQIKALLFQCQDISQLGSVSELSRKILPEGARLLTSSSAEISEPSRDLSAFQGFVQQPRQTIYRYEFETPAGLRVTMAAAARLGKVFFAGGTAPAAGWQDAAQDLHEAVGSFRLLQANRNV